MLLDLGLPDVDGFDVCRRLRSISDIPILVVTARSEEVDRVIGLELGADDYLVKPFGFREPLARIRAVTRRGTPRPVGPRRSSSRVCRSTPGARVVTVDDTEVALTPKEFDLLACLADDPGAMSGPRTAARGGVDARLVRADTDD